MIKNLHINDNWKRIGIRLSGGADSSILYYAICDYFKNRDDVEIYPLTMNTELKWWYSIGAKKVIDRVTELTGKAPRDWYIHYYPDYKDLSQFQKYEDGINEMQRAAVKKYQLDAIYIGLTKNPPTDELKNHFINNDYKLDIEEVLNQIDSRDSTRDTQIYPEVLTLQYDDDNDNAISYKQVIPFANLDKKTVKDMYEFYNVIDTLYPVTYSCEIVPESKTDPLIHCKHCFFCLERWWGFNRIV